MSRLTAQHLAARMENFAPFRVVEVMERAWGLQASGRSVVHLAVGEPDFGTPGPVVEAAGRAIADGRVHYTSSVGIPALREAISGYYGDPTLPIFGGAPMIRRRLFVAKRSITMVYRLVTHHPWEYDACSVAPGLRLPRLGNVPVAISAEPTRGSHSPLGAHGRNGHGRHRARPSPGGAVYG